MDSLQKKLAFDLAKEILIAQVDRGEVLLKTGVGENGIQVTRDQVDRSVEDGISSSLALGRRFVAVAAERGIVPDQVAKKS